MQGIVRIIVVCGYAVRNTGEIVLLPAQVYPPIMAHQRVHGAPYNALSQEVRAATAELAALKFEVLQKVGEAVGNIQTYQL